MACHVLVHDVGSDSGLTKKHITVSLIVSLLWTIPIIAGYIHESGNSNVFLGWMRADDFHRYGNFIEQTAKYGRFIYEEYSAIEPQHPRIIAAYFYILGIFEKVFPLGAQNWWLISRIIMSLLFVKVLMKFICLWTRDNEYRNFLLYFVLFSSGWTWYASKIGILLPRSKNFWMDGFSTFESFHNPLKIAGISMCLWLIITFHRWYYTQKKIYLFGLLVLIPVAWMIHPNSAIPAYCALAGGVANCIYEKKKSCFRIESMIWLLVPFLFIVADIFWMQTDIVTKNIIHQYRVPFSHEHLKNYIIRYGLILILALCGSWRVITKRSLMNVMLLSWLSGSLLFSRLPFMTGLLFQHMVHLPLAVLAGFPAMSLLKSFKKPAFKLFFVVLIWVPFLLHDGGVLFKVAKQTIDDVWPNSLYASPDDMQMMQYLAKLPDGPVLVGKNMGNKIAWLSLKKVFLGHWGTTPDKSTKEKLWMIFFNNDERWSEVKRKMLTNYKIKYIYYGTDERKLGSIPEFEEIIRIKKIGLIELYIVQ